MCIYIWILNGAAVLHNAHSSKRTTVARECLACQQEILERESAKALRDYRSQAAAAAAAVELEGKQELN